MHATALLTVVTEVAVVEEVLLDVIAVAMALKPFLGCIIIFQVMPEGVKRLKLP